MPYVRRKKKRLPVSNVKCNMKQKVIRKKRANATSPSENVNETTENNNDQTAIVNERYILQPVENIDSSSSNRLETDTSDIHLVDSYNSFLSDMNYSNKETMDLYISSLFDHLRFSDEVTSLLPNRSWAIHCTEVPVKRIVVGELVLYNLHGRSFEPFYVKQIIFDESLNFELFLLGTRTAIKDKLPFIRSLTEFESVLDYVDSLKLCNGGPDFSKYSKVNPECAYKDQFSKWRHNLCTLEVMYGDTCESCMSLEEILKRHAQRIHSPLKSRNCLLLTKRRKLGYS